MSGGFGNDIQNAINARQGGMIGTGQYNQPVPYKAGGTYANQPYSDPNGYNTIKQDPTTYGFDPSGTGFQDNPSLMHLLRFGSIPTADELYGPAVTGGATGTQPTGPNTGIVNPNNPDLGQFNLSGLNLGGMNLGQYGGAYGGLGGSGGLGGFGGLYGGQNTYGTATTQGGNLFNGGISPDSYSGGGYFNLSPVTTGKKQADQNMANLARAEYTDYLRRYAPIEDALLATVDKQTYNTEVANRDRLRTASSIINSYGRSAGMEQRRMGRYGLQYEDDGDMQMSQISSLVGGLNSTTRAATDRRNALIGGGLNQIATGAKAGVDFGDDADAEEK